MVDSDVKAIALFFFYTMLDERMAIHASAEAYELALNKIENKINLKTQALIVFCTQQIWQKHVKHFQRGRPQYRLESGWQFPPELELDTWKEFQKKANEEELLALVWSRVLKIEDENIAVGLGLGEGTVRFRVGRAVRKLASMQPKFSVVRS